MTTTITADMFIIPNEVSMAATFYGNYVKNHNEKVEKFNLPTEWNITAADQMVQVWTTGCGSENWANHGAPRGGNFIHALPLRLIEHLKEGDTMSVSFFDKTLEITAAQLKYRYRKFGRFEDTLQRLLELK